MTWCTYFRIRDGSGFDELRRQVDTAAGGYVRYEPRDIDEMTVAAWYRLSQPGDPEWLGLFDVLAGSRLSTDQLGRAHSALVLIRCQGHHYIITFGTGHTIAKGLPVERRFGKVVVSNGKLTDEVRGIAAKVHGTAGKIRIERRGKGGPVRHLEVPREANMTSHLAAKLTLVGVLHIAAGDVGVRTVAPVDVTGLRQILSQLEAWWNNGVERDRDLRDLDRIIEVRDASLVSTLDGRRDADIRKPSAAHRFILALEDDELWDATHIEYFVNRKPQPLVSFDESSILAALQAATRQGVNPLRVRYRASVPTRSEPVWGKLADNLAYETALPKQPGTYVYESGGWFQAASSWAKRVDVDVQRLTRNPAPLTLPYALRGEREADYITRFCGMTSWRRRSCALHLRLHPTLKLELCDVCVDGDKLLFFKRGCDRAACGDVVQQARDCAHALVDSASGFATWANQQLQGKGLTTINLQQRSSLTFIVVLLAGTSKRLPTTFSLRARDALSCWMRDIESLGFQCALTIL